MMGIGRYCLGAGLAFLVAFAPMAAKAGKADVLAVETSKRADGTWTFHVTVRHSDSGWDHYADRWEVLAPDGTVLATRVLAHPHVEEQPFTRSKAGISIPEGVESVTVRVRDFVHGFGGEERIIRLEP